MIKHYIFFARSVLPQPDAAHLIQIAQLANAAANLGYSTVLVSLQQGLEALNPVNLILPFQPRKPDQKLAEFYNFQDKLKVAKLPMPWPIDQINNKFTNSSTIACKYYLPIHISPQAKIVHTRDWNFVKAAVLNGVPAIYERDHYEQKRYEPEIVNSKFFQVAVTVVDQVRDDMIKNGMPPEKVITLHNGFNQLFCVRHPEQAEEWRKKLLADGCQNLVVYAGALFKFKGVDLLIDIAKDLPHIKFALAGGNETQIKAYQQMTRDKQVNNVTFLGYLEQNRLASLLQAADILVAPHCSGEAATFTSPMKLFDYMSAGVPIVATEIPSMMEFKSSQAIAGWCEPDSPTELAKCIQQVLATHPRKPEGYQDNLDFVSQFSWENRIIKILDHVEERMRPQLLESK